jgi:lipopolysaccharide export system protein LptA
MSVVEVAAAMLLLLEATPAAGAPVDVTAKSFRMDKGRCVFVWRGQARLHTSGGVLEADSVEGYAARYDEGGSTRCGPIQRFEAEGNVVLTTRAERSAGAFAVYDVGSQGFNLTEPKSLGPPVRAARPREE